MCTVSSTAAFWLFTLVKSRDDELHRLLHFHFHQSQFEDPTSSRSDLNQSLSLLLHLFRSIREAALELLVRLISSFLVSSISEGAMAIVLSTRNLLPAFYALGAVLLLTLVHSAEAQMILSAIDYSK